MILQSLCTYYDRLAADPSSNIAAPGFQWVPIHFALVLSKDGSFVGWRTMGEGRDVPARLMPQAVKRSSGISANLLWDVPGYVLGHPKDASERQAQRAAEQLVQFRARLDAVFPPSFADVGMAAVRAFYRTGGVEKAKADALWPKVAEAGRAVSFMLEDEVGFIAERPDVLRRVAEAAGEVSDARTGQCLVTGKVEPIAGTHPAIKHVRNAQSSGANMVSFNQRSFESWGRDQGDNAPVSERAVFAYTTVLNRMLDPKSRQHVQIADATTVFWADQPGHAIVDHFASLFEKPPADSEDAELAPVRELLKAVHSGVLPGQDDLERFNVLGLAPNAARLSVRFWYRHTVNEFRRNLALHFDDTALKGGPRDPLHPTLFRMLCSTAVQNKADRIAPNLGGQVMMAILARTPYPVTLLQQALLRARADRDVPHARAAAIKAFLNREIRIGRLQGKEMQMQTDDANDHPAYVCGQLFAAYERTQAAALGTEINATLRDRYFGAASSAPATVMPWLARLNTQHLRKLRREKPKIAGFLEKIVGELTARMPPGGFPRALPMPDQGRFVVGYYHRRQQFFEKREVETNQEDES